MSEVIVLQDRSVFNIEAGINKSIRLGYLLVGNVSIAVAVKGDFAGVPLYVATMTKNRGVVVSVNESTLDKLSELQQNQEPVRVTINRGNS